VARQHRCLVWGSHRLEKATGFFTHRTAFGQVMRLWSCDVCREWWQGRHPEARWEEWPRQRR